MTVEELVDSLDGGGPGEPRIVEFEPQCPDINATWETVKQGGHADQGIQYVKSLSLSAADIVRQGGELEHAMETSSALDVQKGFWSTWPGHVSGFHRDMNLWSVLNFMFCGKKTWYFVDARHVLPRHPNLILGNTSRMEHSIDSGKLGYKVIQTDNQAVYVPGGYYHKVVTDEFSLNFSCWWTPLARLRQRKSITDAWWLRSLLEQKALKKEHVPTVRNAYKERTWLEKLYACHVYTHYLRLCCLMNAKAISQFSQESQGFADEMRRLFTFESFEDAQQAAIARKPVSESNG